MTASLDQSQFPPASRADWLCLVEGVLKGRDFERMLVSRSADGWRIEPVYTKSQAEPVRGRAPGAAWSVLQRIDHPDPHAANTFALEDLRNGANGLTLVCATAPDAHGFGLPTDPEAIAAVLDGIDLDAIDLQIDAGAGARDVARALSRLVRQRGLAPARTRIRFGFDPLGALAVSGSARLDWSGMVPNLAAALSDLRDQGFAGPLAMGDGRPIHAAGGSPAQELAFALASATAILRALDAAGWALEDATDAIEIRLAADQDQFGTIAKMRAARLLWARLREACGLVPRPGFLSAGTAWRMLTRYDPWVNLLRNTVGVFAAGIGGADAVTVMPFTQAIGLPDAFARRLARNTQLVLLEEAHLARVADPAAGSGGLDALTHDLAAAAWGAFQTIENQGGLFAALASGGLQAAVGTMRAQHEAAIGTRRAPLTGTSEFPHLAETPVSVLPVAPVKPIVPDGPVRMTPLQPMRLAEPFERLRDAAQAAQKPPTLFLATLGAVPDFTARSQFARNLFEAGGIVALGNDGFALADGSTSLAALTRAFSASGAPLACLCSSDAVYAREAEAAAAALKAAGASRLYLAGQPGELEARLRAAGIDEFVFSGMDAIAVLKRAQAAASGSGNIALDHDGRRAADQA